MEVHKPKPSRGLPELLKEISVATPEILGSRDRPGNDEEDDASLGLRA